MLCNLYYPKTEDEKLETLHTLYTNDVGCLMFVIILQGLTSHILEVLSIDTWHYQAKSIGRELSGYLGISGGL